MGLKVLSNLAITKDSNLFLGVCGGSMSLTHAVTLLDYNHKTHVAFTRIGPKFISHRIKPELQKLMQL